MRYKITREVPLTDGTVAELVDEVELGTVDHFPAETNSFLVFYDHTARRSFTCEPSRSSV